MIPPLAYYILTHFWRTFFETELSTRRNVGLNSDFGLCGRYCLFQFGDNFYFAEDILAGLPYKEFWVGRLVHDFGPCMSSFSKQHTQSLMVNSSSTAVTKQFFTTLSRMELVYI